jgi:hypothetical protein
VSFVVNAAGVGDAAEGFEDRLSAALTGDGRRLVFETRPVPAACAAMTLWASMNGGAQYHYTGFTLPVVTTPQIKAVVLFFETLNVSWDGMHNR